MQILLRCSSFLSSGCVRERFVSQVVTPLPRRQGFTIVLPYHPSELDKCANDCKHHVDLFSRTILIARVDPKRQRESLVLWPGGPVLKKISNDSKLINNPEKYKGGSGRVTKTNKRNFNKQIGIVK